MNTKFYTVRHTAIFYVASFFAKQSIYFVRTVKFIITGILLITGLLFYTVSAAQCLTDLTDANPVTVTASDAVASFAAANAFNNSNHAYSGWKVAHNPEPGSESWIQVQFTSGAQVIRGYSITPLDDSSGNNNKAPSNWLLQASNDAVGWTTLDSRAGVVFTSLGQTRIYSFSNSTAYNYYRVFISQTSLASADTTGIAELQLFADVCLNGTVFNDNGDRAAAYNAINDTPLPGIPVSIITSPAGNVAATAATNVAGQYFFSASDIPAAGSFTVMITPPADKIFVTQPANLWSTAITLPSIEDAPANGAVFFDYHISSPTNRLASMNRMLFAGGNLDFGLQDAEPPPPFICTGPGSLTNMITEGDGGTFGASSYNWLEAHPHQLGFQYSTNILYSSLPVSITDYGFSSIPGTGGSRGVLLGEGLYTVTSFPGTLSDIAWMPYTNALLNNVNGGWRKSYGITTADVNDRFLAVNGATSGSLPFFKQTGLTLAGGDTYTLAFYGKHANSYAQVSVGGVNDAQIVVEVLDNSSSLITSGNLNLNPPVSYIDDRPESAWQLRMFTFTAPGGGGPFTVQLRASTVSAYGNDFYIDNIVLYPCALGVLPLQLVNFSAQRQFNNNVLLGWEIKEPGNAVAAIQYSTDGSDFYSIHSMPLQPGQSRYSFVHNNAGYQDIYYRLKITDEQDRTIYSEIKKIDAGPGMHQKLLIYPNPVADVLYLQSAEPIGPVVVTDVVGKPVLQVPGSNNNKVQLSTKTLPAGVYYIKLVSGQSLSLHKIIIAR